MGTVQSQSPMLDATFLGFPRVQIEHFIRLVLKDALLLFLKKIFN